MPTASRFTCLPPDHDVIQWASMHLSEGYSPDLVVLEFYDGRYE
jgi:hypothetical protein